MTWSAAGLSVMTSAACRSALLALCSPSAAITWINMHTGWYIHRHIVIDWSSKFSCIQNSMAHFSCNNLQLQKKYIDWTDGRLQMYEELILQQYSFMKQNQQNLCNTAVLSVYFIESVWFGWRCNFYNNFFDIGCLNPCKHTIILKTPINLVLRFKKYVFF